MDQSHKVVYKKYKPLMYSDRERVSSVFNVEAYGCFLCLAHKRDSISCPGVL